MLTNQTGPWFSPKQTLDSVELMMGDLTEEKSKNRVAGERESPTLGIPR